jgi:hypothetical protein
MKIFTDDPGKGKRVLVGELKEGILHRDSKPEHFMFMMNGYGIQEIIFEAMKASGVEQICQNIIGQGVSYLAPLETWQEHGVVRDFRHGPQRFLSLKYMDKVTH